MPFLTLSDTELFYTYGEFGHDQTILFSNSLGTDHTMWEPQMDLLSHHFNILRYDTRGHGQSGLSEGEYTVAQLGKDVLELMDALNLEKVVFCGISMGGLTGQWLGIHAPKRFEHLILSNTAAKIGNAGGWNSRIAEVTANGLESIGSGTAGRWFSPSFNSEHKDQVDSVLAVFIKNQVSGYTACCAAVRDADFREDLFKIEVPVLIISGLQDLVTTVEDGKYLAKRIPVARHVQLDAAHLSSIEQADEFSKLILFQTQH